MPGFSPAADHLKVAIDVAGGGMRIASMTMPEIPACNGAEASHNGCSRSVLTPLQLQSQQDIAARDYGIGCNYLNI